MHPYIDWILECRLVALDRPSMKLLRSQMCDPILQQNAAREGAASKRFHPIHWEQSWTRHQAFFLNPLSFSKSVPLDFPILTRAVCFC